MISLTAAALSVIATGRDVDLFSDDITQHTGALRDALSHSRLLLIGGAGSIGSSTARALADFGPACLHVIDQDENGLAELVRDLRSEGRGLSSCDLRALPIDYGGAIAERFVRDEAPYDFVLNFAAMKHVRSEKDVYSLTQMIETNVLKHLRFLKAIREYGRASRYFVVSTDKAANSTSAMGATKRLVERITFSDRFGPGCVATSARFANVAFSNGSLLAGFLHRLQRRQPLAVPEATRRFFVSFSEAASICMLSAVIAPAGIVTIPRAGDDFVLKPLDEIAGRFLDAHGLTPRWYRQEAEARASVARDLSQHAYPVLVTPLDTAGEKEYEEFVGHDEIAMEIGFKSLSGIVAKRSDDPSLEARLRAMADIIESNSATKEQLVRALADVVPTFAHRETFRSLDDRM